jgi:hypothetical protein
MMLQLELLYWESAKKERRSQVFFLALSVVVKFDIHVAHQYFRENYRSIKKKKHISKSSFKHQAKKSKRQKDNFHVILEWYS